MITRRAENTDARVQLPLRPHNNKEFRMADWADYVVENLERSEALNLIPWKQCPCGWRGPEHEQGENYCPRCARVTVLEETKARMLYAIEDGGAEGLYGLLHYVELTPNLDWLVLIEPTDAVVDSLHNALRRQSYPNLWIGCFAENQDDLTKGVFALLKIPAAGRFLVLFPLHGPVDLENVVSDTGVNALGYQPFNHTPPSISWVITAGDTGENSKPTHPQWLRTIRDQCQRAGIPFFFVQWGDWSLIRKDTPVFRDGELVHWRDSRQSSDFGVLSPGGVWYPQSTGWNGRAIDPDTQEAYMIKVGKSVAGCLLDGREWKETPKGMGQ